MAEEAEAQERGDMKDGTYQVEQTIDAIYLDTTRSFDIVKMTRERMLDQITRELGPALLDKGPTVVRLTSYKRQGYEPFGRCETHGIRCELQAAQRMQVQICEMPEVVVRHRPAAVPRTPLRERLAKIPVYIDKAESWLERQQAQADIRHGQRCAKVAAVMSFQDGRK